MEVVISNTYEQLSKAAARAVAKTLNSKPNAVLGLATGGTPLGLYQELIRLHKDEGLDFSQVSTFNLDEYVGLKPDHPQSYHYFMHENLFKHINIAPHNVHIPSGTTDNYQAFCDSYEQRIAACGGIDLQVLGIGSDGHIGFNEPASSLGSRTRIKTLTKQTIDDNARFFGEGEKVPSYAITMGVGTILEAKRIILLANGEGKAEIVAKAIEGPVTSRMRNFTREDFARSHPAGSLGRKLSKVDHHLRALAQCRVAPEEKTVRQIFVDLSVPGRRTGAIMLVDGQGKLSGIFTDSDLARLFEHRREHALDLPIREVMTARPVTVQMGTKMIDALAAMGQRKTWMGVAALVTPNGEGSASRRWSALDRSSRHLRLRHAPLQVGPQPRSGPVWPVP